jgi:hypothetical protein
MAHARQVERAFPRVAINPITALVAAILFAALVAFSAFGPLGLLGPTVEGPNVDPALAEAEARWELHRKLQTGDLEPLRQAEREWVRQRLEQSPSY